MTNGNGWVVKTLVGFMFTIIFFAVTFMGRSVIGNDKESRFRDDCLDERIDILESKNALRFEAIMVAQKGISKDQQYTQQSLEDIKKLLVNGHN